ADLLADLLDGGPAEPVLLDQPEGGRVQGLPPALLLALAQAGGLVVVRAGRHACTRMVPVSLTPAVSARSCRADRCRSGGTRKNQLSTKASSSTQKPTQ